MPSVLYHNPLYVVLYGLRQGEWGNGASYDKLSVSSLSW